jgi:hypothetical protein
MRTFANVDPKGGCQRFDPIRDGSPDQVGLAYACPGSGNPSMMLCLPNVRRSEKVNDMNAARLAAAVPTNGETDYA